MELQQYPFVCIGATHRRLLPINLLKAGKELAQQSKFGNELDWQRLDDGKGSRVAFYLNNVSVFNEEDWDKMIEFMTGNMIKFEKAVKDILPEVLKK